MSDPKKLSVTLADIEEARNKIKSVVRVTEVDKSISASKKLGLDVYLKHENTQITGSFKLRGGLNKIQSLTADEKKRGVIASSAGNHAQGVAFSASSLGVKSTIVMPENAPLIKVEATKAYGANVISYGDVVDDATEHARKLERDEGLVFVHPYEDAKIIAGQGTIGLEIMQALPDVDSIVVPIGGGGLISGIATAVKTLKPSVRVIGVVSQGAAGMSRMFAGQPAEHLPISTIADGIAIKKPSQAMYEQFISKLVDEVVTVSDEEIADAIVFSLERAKTVVEGAGAVGLAAVFNRKLQLGAKTCVVLSGGNIDLNMVAQIIQMGQIHRGRLCQLSVVVDDLPGSLSRLTKVIADARANVLEVHHNRVGQGLHLRETRIDVVLEARNLEHVEQIKATLAKNGVRILP